MGGRQKADVYSGLPSSVYLAVSCYTHGCVEVLSTSFGAGASHWDTVRGSHYASLGAVVAFRSIHDEVRRRHQVDL